MLPNCIFRKAVVDDAQTIKQMVYGEWLNPIGLDWRNFWVIEREQTVIACVQLRPWGNFKELSSLVVLSDYRKNGIGTYLAKSAIEQANTSVYLSCGSNLKSFYRRCSFKQVSRSKIPIAIAFEFGLSWIIAASRRKQLIFMAYIQPQN